MSTVGFFRVRVPLANTSPTRAVIVSALIKQKAAPKCNSSRAQGSAMWRGLSRVELSAADDL